MPRAARSPLLAQNKPTESAGNGRLVKALRRMLQDQVNAGSSVANFDSVLVLGQPIRLAQESQMLSLYTNLMIRLRSEKGATAVEYGIMVALIAVVIIVAVTLLGGTLTETFNGVACSVKGGTYTAATAASGTTAAVAGSCSK